MKSRLIFLGVITLSLAGFCGAIVLILYGPGATNSSDRGDVRSPEPMVFPPARGIAFYEPGAIKRENVTLTTSSLSDESGSAPIYRALSPVFDDAYARSIAKKLGMEGEPRSEMPDWCAGEGATLPQCIIFADYKLENEDAELEINPGWFTYSRKSADASETPHEVSDHTAASVAKTYLWEHSLLPDFAEVSEIQRDEEAQGVEVEFRDARLNERLPDFRIQVTLDKHGTVERVDYRWFDLLPLANYPIISELEAFNRIFDGPSNPGILILSDRLDLTAPELYYEIAYDAQPDSEKVSGPMYYLPFYRFCQPENEFACIRVPALPLEYIFPPGVSWPPSDQ